MEQTKNKDGIVATYIRVSTEDQQPENHRSEVIEFIESEFPEWGQREYADIYTGTSTVGRQEYNKLRDDIQQENIHSVVTTSVSRVARSIRDFSDFVHTCEENETALYFTKESIKYDPRSNDPYQRAMLQMLGVFAELEAKITQQRTKESIRQMRADGYKWGRSPLGFSKNSGDLYPTDDFDRICGVLDLIDSGELSQSKGAHMLDTSRTTIKRILEDNERRELYDLPVQKTELIS